MEYRGAPFGVSAQRAGDTLFIRIYRDEKLLVEFETTHSGGKAIADTIVKALSE